MTLCKLVALFLIDPDIIVLSKLGLGYIRSVFLVDPNIVVLFKLDLG